MVAIYKVEYQDASFDAVAGLVADSVTGEILYAPRVTEEMFGYFVQGILVGKSIDILVPPAVRTIHKQHREAYAKDPRTRPMGVGKKLEGIRQDGTTFPVTISLKSFVSIGGRVCVFVNIVDMTDRA